MTTHAPPMLTAEHLTFGFPGKQILDAVGFALRPGTITCLLGGNWKTCPQCCSPPK